MTLDLVLSIFWHEPRVGFQDECFVKYPELVGGRLVLDQANFDNLWQPPVEVSVLTHTETI